MALTSWRTAEYLELVDWTGRLVKPGRRGRIGSGAPPFLGTITAHPTRGWAWSSKTFSRAGTVGLVQFLWQTPREVQMATARPDLSARPSQCVIESAMKASPHAIYKAWTEEFDRWFAAPGTVLMRAEVDAPYFFETHYDGGRHPHYGRFLDLRRDQLVEMTWVTGSAGTEGAETVVSVEIAPRGPGSHIRLTHSGFPNDASMKRHDKAWVAVLANLDKTLSGDA